MVVVPQTGEGYAVVVAKKVARLSVTRHKMKRRILAALRTLTLPQALLVFPRASAVTMDLKSIKEELAELLYKIPAGRHAKNSVQ
jgi:ribonuclease P protein component